MRKIKTILIILIFSACFIGVLELITEIPPFGKAENSIHNEVYERYVGNSTEDTGIPNMVTSIVLDYRAYDTMFETIVLFAATVAVVITLKSSKKESVGK